MIKCALLPGLRRVAIAAFFTLLAIMNVYLLVAVKTFVWRFMVFLFRFVTCFTARFGMHTFEQEIGF